MDGAFINMMAFYSFPLFCNVSNTSCMRHRPIYVCIASRRYSEGILYITLHLPSFALVVRTYSYSRSRGHTEETRMLKDKLQAWHTQHVNATATNGAPIREKYIHRQIAEFFYFFFIFAILTPSVSPSHLSVGPGSPHIERGRRIFCIDFFFLFIFAFGRTAVDMANVAPAYTFLYFTIFCCCCFCWWCGGVDYMYIYWLWSCKIKPGNKFSVEGPKNYCNSEK